MKEKLKKLFPWICVILVILTIAAVSNQVRGPAAATTHNAVVRWKGTSAWLVTNSPVIIDDYGNISGIATQTVSQLEITETLIADQINSASGTVTNGIIYLQQSFAPTAEEIGGTLGSITNHLIRNAGGYLFDYYSDGTTVYTKQLSP